MEKSQKYQAYYIENTEIYPYKYKNYKCHITYRDGYHCGYVSLKPDSYVGMQIAKAIRLDSRRNGVFIVEDKFEVHGGISFIDISKNNNILIGFDCSHYGDLTKVIGHCSAENATFKDKNFVKKELRSLVSQILEYEKNKNLNFNQERILWTSKYQKL